MDRYICQCHWATVTDVRSLSLSVINPWNIDAVCSGCAQSTCIQAYGFLAWWRIVPVMSPCVVRQQPALGKQPVEQRQLIGVKVYVRRLGWSWLAGWQSCCIDLSQDQTCSTVFTLASVLHTRLGSRQPTNCANSVLTLVWGCRRCALVSICGWWLVMVGAQTFTVANSWHLRRFNAVFLNLPRNGM